MNRSAAIIVGTLICAALLIGAKMGGHQSATPAPPAPGKSASYPGCGCRLS